MRYKCGSLSNQFRSNIQLPDNYLGFSYSQLNSMYLLSKVSVESIIFRIFIVLNRWMVSSKGTCQPGCGPGTQRIYFRCVKHHIASGANLVRPNEDCRLVEKPPSEQPCEGTCDNVLWMYSRWTEVSGGHYRGASIVTTNARY